MGTAPELVRQLIAGARRKRDRCPNRLHILLFTAVPAWFATVFLTLAPLDTVFGLPWGRTAFLQSLVYGTSCFIAARATASVEPRRSTHHEGPSRQ